MDTQEPVSFETYFGPLDLWVEVNAYPSETGLSVYFRDVGDRVERERELERYETIVETVDDGVYVLDEDFRFVQVNDAYVEMTGYDREDLLGTHCSLVIDEEVSMESSEILEEISDGDAERGVLEADIRRADGTGLRAESRFSTLPPGSGGEGTWKVGVVRDVTDRVERERELAARARQQGVVAELGHDALDVEDLDALFARASRRVADALGADYCKVLDLDAGAGKLLLRQGVGWKEGLLGEATVPAREDDSQAAYTLRSAEPVVVEDLDRETRFGGPDLLTDHGVRSGVSTIVGPPDDPWGILGVHDTARREFSEHDVTFVQSVANVLAAAIERWNYRNDLEELVDELEESNERLEQFAYIASHDLKEPLRMVSNYLQLVESRYADELDEDGREFIDFAVDGAERMREMIDDLLAYSRIDTEAEPPEPTDCEEVVEDVLRNLHVRIDEHDVEVEVDPLPTVTADRSQLEQVFQNLISNAVKYRGDESPRIEIGATERDDEWEFHVADDGIGIAPERQDRIFEVFRRLHTREEYPGTGIGLALCRKIVERHGGRIRVESEPGEGSTFYFTLPRTPADRPAGGGRQ